MARHTAERIMELMSDGVNRTPEEVAEILELPIHKVRKKFRMIYNKKELKL